MSWTVIAQRASMRSTSTPTKYKVTAFHKEDPSAISSEMEINREDIIEDFQRLLPFISGIRFRSLKLKFSGYTWGVLRQSLRIPKRKRQKIIKTDSSEGYRIILTITI